MARIAIMSLETNTDVFTDWMFLRIFKAERWNPDRDHQLAKLRVQGGSPFLRHI